MLFLEHFQQFVLFSTVTKAESDLCFRFLFICLIHTLISSFVFRGEREIGFADYICNHGEEETFLFLPRKYFVRAQRK